MNAPSGSPERDWAEFVDHYRGDAPRLVAFVMAMGTERERAVALAQESMVALWRDWSGLTRAPGAHARRVAVRAGARTEVAAVQDDGHPVLAALATLPPVRRDVLVATLDALPPDDVAHVLEIDPETVGATAAAARRALETLLGGCDARQAYLELVADVAAGTDVEAGLADVAASAPGRPRPVAGGAPADPVPAREATDVPDELVAAAMAGDRTAVARLLDVIRPLVVRYCRGRLGPTDRSLLSADDVAQEVCVAVLTALPGYRMQGRPFLAFVYGIASHKVIDAHRAVARGRAEPVADVPDSVEVEAGPEQRVLLGELSGRLRDLLDRLPDKQREILVLRIVVGLTAEETAEIVGATPGAVRVAQHRALQRLRRDLPPGLGRDER